MFLRSEQTAQFRHLCEGIPPSYTYESTKKDVVPCKRTTKVDLEVEIDKDTIVNFGVTTHNCSHTYNYYYLVYEQVKDAKSQADLLSKIQEKKSKTCYK